LTIVNSVVINMGEQMFFDILLSFHFDIHWVVGLCNYTVVLLLIFLGTFILFFILATLIYITANSMQGFSCISLPALTFCHFDNSCSYLHKVLTHCSFDLHFPDD
jgi:hypothetical protein